MSVLVVISSENEAVALSRWGFHFAAAAEQDLEVLYVPEGKEEEEKSLSFSSETPADISSSDPLLAEIAGAVSGLAQGFKDIKFPVVNLRRIVSASRLEDLTNLIRESDCEILLLGKHESKRSANPDAVLSHELFQRAGCQTVMMRLAGSEGQQVKRILVPASGGPHAGAALRLGKRLMDLNDAELTPLFVEPNLGECAAEVGERVLARVLKDAGIEESEKVKPRVVLSDDIRSGISDEAAQGYDLLMVGAST